MKQTLVAPMEAASPDLEKQGFFAVVFIYREYSAQRDELCTEQKNAAPKKQQRSSL
ncbi:hypothetical protein K5V07_00870 [Flavobacterium sp. CHNK8]|uniref:hypothetical protein n=1 Tax=Flavobacterium sp. CHNK8 TaxID=2871165 RepID=UPI001C8CFE02|nr:hypothetical protein [Flavobacterium sp. CHNK8]QZK89118.1 hypothetical protein K5V07_00870 [Flavobacterium sp. CHNK8]